MAVYTYITAERIPRELVVCSLEPWDAVWRRNQFLVDGLLRRNSDLRVLFVEPPSDLLHGALQRRLPGDPRIRRVRDRLWALRPWKPLPRLAGPWTDRTLLAQVRLAARRLGFDAPLLWVNDTTYAPLVAETGWRSLYDVTDDWLLARAPERELGRRRRLEQELLACADEVVVCSPGLAASRGRSRSVTLVPNGVDVELFRAVHRRPLDLAPRPAAVYVGTLHDDRVDVPLVLELAASSSELTVVLVGPDALSTWSRRRLVAQSNVHVLGARPHRDVPAYLQHADVVIVPHVVSPFTDSLDPIKAYECLAVGTPTVATRVAGFRELAGAIAAVPREAFCEEVARVLNGESRDASPVPLPDLSWESRCRAFEAALSRAAVGRREAA